MIPPSVGIVYNSEVVLSKAKSDKISLWIPPVGYPTDSALIKVRGKTGVYQLCRSWETNDARFHHLLCIHHRYTQV